MKVIRQVGVALVMVLMAASMWTGCESAEGTDGVGLLPSSAVLGGSSTNSYTQVFTAQVTGALALPLEWRVSNSALGNIISASGSNATYQANVGRSGENVITVADQYGNEGSAVVVQK